MITLNFAFWTFVLLFACIGAMRGWAKEVLVAFSVVVALFILDIMNYFPPIRNLFAQPNSDTEFWIRTAVLLTMVFFGYQTPRVARFASGKFMRERFSDSLLGFFIGAINGFLIIGCIWWFMIDSNYPLQPGIVPPNPIPEIVKFLPPEWLNGMVLYFAMMVAFLFLIIVLI